MAEKMGTAYLLGATQQDAATKTDDVSIFAPLGSERPQEKHQGEQRVSARGMCRWKRVPGFAVQWRCIEDANVRPVAAKERQGPWRVNPRGGF